MQTTAGEAADPLVGRLLDERYLLESVLAYGGMATVYRGTDTRLDRTVAVKVMSRRYADDPEFVARFTREAKASARLSTPEVVAVHDYGTDRTSGVAYLVMELVRGQNLRQLLQQNGPLPPGPALALVERVLMALAAAHAAGLVHRDIKPENVLLGENDGRVKVADFGLARAVETNNLTATTGLLLGTVAYLAPEQVLSGRADARTDVYATGVLLWELLTGVPPHSADSPMSVAYKHVNEDVPPPSTAVRGIPPALDALVVRATSREPAARPADGGAFLAELRAVAADLPADVPAGRRAGSHPTQVIPLVPPPAPSGPARLAPPRRRRGRAGLVAAAVVLLLALLALGGGYYLGTRYTHTPGVLGMSRASATARLTAQGLSVRIGGQVYDETLPAGSVRRQSPGPGARTSRHATVTLVLSRGPDRRSVPAVAGSTLPAASAALQGQGLVAGTVTRTFSVSVPAGAIISSVPPAGTRLRPGTAVGLVLSRGVEQLPVPDETGVPAPAAETALQSAGFRTSSTQAFSDSVPEGSVLAQVPATGLAPRGSTVTLQVSRGPDLVTVPGVSGRSVGKATSLLKEAGLKARTETVLPEGPGIVIAQSPNQGRQVKRGSTVTLIVV